MHWRTGRFSHDLTTRGLIMGILNVTPDSFSDGGNFLDVPRAVEHALAMLAEGAAIIDVGGESTRPGAAGLPAAEEMRRVLPVIEAVLSAAPDCVLSIDTSKAIVARESILRGASIVNDVTALRGDATMAATVSETGVGVILMHMQGTPLTMQDAPAYVDVVADVAAFLKERCSQALAAGIAADCLAVDPGIGFGKTLEHNVRLLRHLDGLRPGNHPLVLGVSRKGFLAHVAGTRTIPERLWPTVALTALLRRHGANVFRVHDVGANVAALRTAEAMMAADG